MKKVYFISFLFIVILLFSNCKGSGLITVKSSFDVSETADRLQKIVTEKGMTVMATVDHGANAKKVDKDLRPTELLIFGNPNIGTALMQSDQKIGIDLPVKALIWEDADGEVWISYNDPEYLAGRHNISDKDEVFQKMSNALAGFVKSATE